MLQRMTPLVEAIQIREDRYALSSINPILSEVNTYFYVLINLQKPL